MKEPMTTEEMNREIAEYLGWEWNERGYYKVTNMELFYRVQPNYCADELNFDKDFAMLMPVWQKLRGELVNEQIKCDTDPKRWANVGYLKSHIEKAILDTDITTAHRLMVEAIELIKK